VRDHEDVTSRRWRAAAALGGCVVALTACPAAPERVPEEPTTAPPSTAQALPGLPTGASTGLPAYEGPPGDAPSTAGPLLGLRAAVDLTAATPRVFARAQAAVGAPDGGAHVVLTPADADLEQRLVTVGGPGAGYPITGSVPMPRVAAVWGMHLQDDGTVAVVGQLAEGGYGAVVVDPVSGAGRSVLLLPAPDGRTSVDGRSAAQGTRLHLFVTLETGDGRVERLVAADLGTGRVLAVRDVAEEVAAASRLPVGSQFGGLVPRPGGGVTLAFDASPTDVAEERIPTLLSYDARLAPVGEPVRVTDLAEGAEIQAVTGTGDGTVFLLVEVRDATWVLAVPDGGGAGPVLAQLSDRIYDYALVVEPAQVWGLLPAAEGVRAVDLSTGEVAGPLPLDCGPNLDVTQVLPGAEGAVLLGECDDPREDTQMVWFLGPA
jgi:hypothetical protein